MDRAELWQERVVGLLEAEEVALLNPRRSDWDSSWRQSIDVAPFREQVGWELCHLEVADAVLMYFDPRTKSPITLLELGLFARKGNLVVCSPLGFWRRGNIEVVCQVYQVVLTTSLDWAVGYAMALALRGSDATT